MHESLAGSDREEGADEVKTKQSGRTTYTLLNAVTAILATLVNGALGLVVTRLVISRFGSDFNGLDSTANQIINVLLVLEGGFTLASNVALFAPVANNEYGTINGVLKATRNKFRKIAGLFLAAGCVTAFVYTLTVNSGLPKELIFTVIIMAVLPQVINLFFATTYRVLLQSQQREYVISSCNALTFGLAHLTNIFMITHGGQMWMVRFVTMVYALVNSLLIFTYTRKKNTYLDFRVEARPEMITGTNDVMAQKITGVVYAGWPIIFLSITPNGGTMLASVYAVYNNVFMMLKALLYGIVDAPRLSFGQMMTERKREEVWPVFKEYEFVALFCVFIAFTTISALIMPFVTMFTTGVEDINYKDAVIALFMIAIGVAEMLHIPCGHMINMSGNFRVSKRFQIIACGILIVLMTILGLIFGVYGMLTSILIVAVLLAVLEIGWMHGTFFEHKTGEFLKMVIPYLVCGAALVAVEITLSDRIGSIGALIGAGAVLALAHTVIALGLGFVFSRKEARGLFGRIQGIMKGFGKEKKA